MVSIIDSFKQIYDSVHGYIPISNLAIKIIDNKHFQRLRSLHQLGTCYYVFPGAVHSRFEHSIGTYYLAGRIINCIKNRTSENDMHKYLSEIEELNNYFLRNKITRFNLDDYICELVKIAALCHDLGHGPFSHVFDDVFIPSIKNSSKVNSEELHENRSCLILEYIINNDKDLKNIIKSDEIQFMKNLINPKEIHKSFIYQIVSNNVNSLDVDKYDYIKRDTQYVGLKYNLDCSRLVDDVFVIDNNICYPKQVYYEIICLFSTRYRLHKQVYCHKAVISIQFMINDIMKILNPILNISDSIYDVEKFSLIDDYYIFSSVNTIINMLSRFPRAYKNDLEKVNEAKKIIDRIKTRDIYKFINCFVSSNKININYDLFNNINDKINKEDICIHCGKIGFVSGNKGNPLNNIFYYDTKVTVKKSSKNRSFKIAKNEVSSIVPDNHQEYIVMIYSKKNEKTDIIRKACEEISKSI